MKEKNVYILSSIILIVASFCSTGYYNLDEHVQILEFAALKLNLAPASSMPWEFHCQMRSAIQPAIVVLSTHIFNHIGISSPFIIALFLRLISAAIAFLSMYLIYKTYSKTIADIILKKW